MEVFDLNNHQQQQVQSTEKLFQPYTPKMVSDLLLPKV